MRSDRPVTASRCSFVTLLCLIAIGTSSTALPAHASKLSKAQKMVVEEAIEVLKGYEECCDPTLPDGIGEGVSIVECLETVLENGNICRAGLPEGVKGRKTLDDKSANCGDKDIIKVSRSVLKKKTRETFPLLLVVLYHEAVHALQDLSEFETSDYKDKTTAKLEKQAWTAQKGVIDKFKGALEKVVDNIDNGKARDEGLDDCEKKLVACYLDEDVIDRDKLKNMLRDAKKLAEVTDETIEELCDTIDEKCPPKPPEDGKPRGDAKKNNKAVAEAEEEEDGSGPVDPNNSRIVTSFPRTGKLLLLESGPLDEEFRLEFPSGLTEVFGIAWQLDATLREYLIVCGHRHGVGTVQFWRDETPTIPDALVLVSELDVDAVTSAPSGLVPFGLGGAGGFLIWDEFQSQMFALVDTDGDGAVDAIDPTPRYLLPHSPAGLTSLEADDVDEVTGIYEYTISEIALGSMTGDLPWISVIDVDADGFFTPADVSYHGDPLDDPRRGPGFGSRPMEGFTSVIATGPELHDVQLWKADAQGDPQSPLSSVATIGPDNEVVLDVTDPGGLVLDDPVLVLDLTNGKSSLERPVETARPEVDRAFGNRSPGAGGQVVFQRGVLLDTLVIQDVLVDGNSALSFTVDSTGVTYITPPNTPVPGDGVTDVSRIVAVELLYDDGTGNVLALRARPVSYYDPILTADYECRKGNVNGATGVVVDVLFADDYAGNGNARYLLTTPTDPFHLDIVAPPSRPGGPSKYVVYAWLGSPDPGSVVSLPRQTGPICRRTPLDGPPGLPKRIANNLGKPQLGTENWPGPPTLPAPYRLLDSPGGLGLIGTFTFQGIILDAMAPNGVIAVTNAVIVETRL